LSPGSTCFYTLPLHDALPISVVIGLSESSWRGDAPVQGPPQRFRSEGRRAWPTAARKPRSTLIFHVERILLAIHSLNCWLPDAVDRKSTRLNSSHQIISYAVF